MDGYLSVSSTPGIIVVTFSDDGVFVANDAAEKWCAARGIAVGEMQRGAPRGLLYGNYRISKWRNLNRDERRELDGTMSGDGRLGPITIRIREKQEAA